MRKFHFVIMTVMLLAASSLLFAEDIILPPPKRMATVVKEAGGEISALKIPPSNISYYFHPYMPDPTLPEPSKTHLPPKRLSLHEAILLALRNNPMVINSELQRIVDKYQVQLAYYAFEPRYTFNTTATISRGLRPVYDLNTNVSVMTPVGTQINLNYTNPLDGSHGIGTLTIDQPLLRGFGFVNKIPFLNALDTDAVARLTYKGNIIDVVVNVILAYRVLVQDYNRLEVTQRTVAAAAEAVRITRLKVMAGKVANNELLQQQTDLAQTRLTAIQQKNAIQLDYQALLSAIGVIPNANLIINKDIDFSKVRLPTKQQAIQIALHNNIAYQSAVLQLRINDRAVLLARDARRIQLDVTGSTTVGNTLAAPGSGDIFVNANMGPSLTFFLNIPIDDFQAKVDYVNAKIAYEQAQLTLQQQKEDLVRAVITQLATLENQREQIIASQLTVKLQTATLRDANIRLRYGKTTAFEVTQLRNELLEDQTNLVDTKIAYLNTVTQFNQLLGITLDKWDIELRY